MFDTSKASKSSEGVSAFVSQDGLKLNGMSWDFSALVWVYIPVLVESGGIGEEDG